MDAPIRIRNPRKRRHEATTAECSIVIYFNANEVLMKFITFVLGSPPRIQHWLNGLDLLSQELQVSYRIQKMHRRHGSYVSVGPLESPKDSEIFEIHLAGEEENKEALIEKLTWRNGFDCYLTSLGSAGVTNQLWEA